ncbi:MAG TPA: amidohydrolase family protein [Phycisphaerae bacterium]|nr:amidohydrolase family protein [Phycisphaerae bacterium]
MHHQILSAPLVLAAPDQLIQDGAVVINDSLILAIGKRSEILRQFPSAVEKHFDGHVLLPGFVNAHTHLELGFLAGKIPGPAFFPEWVLKLQSSFPPQEQIPQVVSTGVCESVRQSLRFGVTTVGDITRRHQPCRSALQNVPSHVVSFGEVMALGRLRDQLDARFAAAVDDATSSDRLTIGVSPHAPYSVEGPALKKIAALAEKRRLPLAMHLAEHSEESQFLADLSGPLGREWELMRQLDLLDDKIPLFNGSPIQWAKHYGLLDITVPVILAHVNYTSDDDLALLSRPNVSVAYCPRTRRYFGHDSHSAHRWPDMLSRGINVCLATDSLASNPDLSVLREAQFVYQNYRDSNLADLYAMITTRPSAALGLADHVGRLSPGFYADIQAVPIDSSAEKITDVLEVLISEAPLPSALWINGVQVKIP